MLEECQILLSLQEADLEVHEAILAEELECDLHSSDGRDLSAELDKARALADGITDERATEAMQLSQRVMGISSALVDLGMLPIQDIAQLLKLAQEVLSVADLVLKHLQEALASCVGPQDLGSDGRRTRDFVPSSPSLFHFFSVFLPFETTVKDVPKNFGRYIPGPLCPQPQ
jgi:hypothetical protein